MHNVAALPFEFLSSQHADEWRDRGSPAYVVVSQGMRRLMPETNAGSLAVCCFWRTLETTETAFVIESLKLRNGSSQSRSGLKTAELVMAGSSGNSNVKP